MIKSEKYKIFNYKVQGIILLIIAGLTITGNVQKIIAFKDPVNELLFFLSMCILGILFMLCDTVDNSKDYR